MSIEVKSWKCEKCGKVWLTKPSADNCCKEKAAPKCRVCGCEVKPPWMICTPCKEAERYKNAKKVPYSQYKIEMFYDERTEKFFSNKDDIEEEYENISFDESANRDTPAWVYGCRKIPFAIDIDNALESEAEEMHEDFSLENEAVDLKELYDFIKDWNAKQDAATYEIDYKTVVLLNE